MACFAIQEFSSFTRSRTSYTLLLRSITQAFLPSFLSPSQAFFFMLKRSPNWCRSLLPLFMHRAPIIRTLSANRTPPPFPPGNAFSTSLLYDRMAKTPWKFAFHVPTPIPPPPKKTQTKQTGEHPLARSDLGKMPGVAGKEEGASPRCNEDNKREKKIKKK